MIRFLLAAAISLGAASAGAQDTPEPQPAVAPVAAASQPVAAASQPVAAASQPVAAASQPVAAASQPAAAPVAAASQPSVPPQGASSQSIPNAEAQPAKVAPRTAAEQTYLERMLWLEDRAVVVDGAVEHRYRFFQGDAPRALASELTLEELLVLTDAQDVIERRASKQQWHWLAGMLPLYGGLVTGGVGVATVFTALMPLFGPGVLGATLGFLTPAALPMVVGGTLLIVVGGVVAAAGQITSRYIVDDDENIETYGLRGLVLQYNAALRESSGVAADRVPAGILQR